MSSGAGKMVAFFAACSTMLLSSSLVVVGSSHAVWSGLSISHEAQHADSGGELRFDDAEEDREEEDSKAELFAGDSCGPELDHAGAGRFRGPRQSGVRPAGRCAHLGRGPPSC